MSKIPPHKIIRSRRRSIGLQITSDASLIVRAPMKVSQSYIDKVINEKKDWINKQQSEMLRKSNEIIAKQYIDGEDFLYLGDTYKLNFVNDQKEDIIVCETDLLITKELASQSKIIIENWYKKKAIETVIAKVNIYSQNIDLKHNGIKISNAHTYWGSCNPKGGLNFSWRLIMAPHQVIDYVVVHELAHLKHRNHSRHFWSLVEDILPNYKTERKWLKNNGHLLKI